MGCSGSGKSTLLNLMGGLDVPDEGEVMLDSWPLHSLPEKCWTLIRRQKVGYVFQKCQLLPMLNDVENIAFPMLVNRCPLGENPM